MYQSEKVIIRWKATGKEVGRVLLVIDLLDLMAREEGKIT